jgi:WD40 repeat protein
MLATGSVDATVKVWDVRTGRNVGTFTGHTDVIHTVAFNSDASAVASAGDDGYVRVHAVVQNTD